MKYLELISTLRKQKTGIFNLNDIENLFPDENRKTLKNALSRWTSRGMLARLKKGVYEFSEPGADVNTPDLYVANRLYEPSYISLETALSFYGLIPDVAAQVTSVTTKPTRTFKNKYGLFLYRSFQKDAFIGYGVMKYEGSKILIADREKALIDFLYYNFRHADEPDFDEMRLDTSVLKKLNRTKLKRYAGLFSKKTRGILKDLERWLDVKR